MEIKQFNSNLFINSNNFPASRCNGKWA